MRKRLLSLTFVMLMAAMASACDRKNAAPQDLESGKAPTGTIEPAKDRVDRSKAGEVPDAAQSPRGTTGGASGTSNAAAAGGGAGGGGTGPAR